MIITKGVTIGDLVIRKLLTNRFIVADENKNYLFCGDAIDLCFYKDPGHTELFDKKVADIGYVGGETKGDWELILYINSKEE